MEEENTQRQIMPDVSENVAPVAMNDSTQLLPEADPQEHAIADPQADESADASSGAAADDYDNLSPEQVDELLKERLPRQELHTKGLVKRYGRRTVADNVSFNVKQGEIVGLLGPNGAGKTTSFYMTTGLIIPNEGHVYIDDKEITSYPVYKRARAGIGYLPQEASVFRKMSVEDNIMAVLEMTKLTHQQQLDKLESLIAEFRLQKVRKNKGDRLSGGERRRTEIARCLAIDPKFIMLDEPFAGVDPIAVEDIQHIVWRLKYRNIGILITDHNVQETLSITDRAYLLFEGRILFQGLPEELAENKIVRKNYLSDNFVYRKFQSNEDDRAFAANARKQLLKEISR
jgi:lipopolysaccharide export system ATP-binding protein